MTKYRLKDQELQKKLDGLTKGAFSKWLLEQADINGFGDGTTYWVKLGEAIELYVLVSSEAVEVIAEYNPNAWNNYPENQPPMDLHMRVETATGFKCCAEFDGENWMYRSLGENRVQGLRVLKNVVRYRPWSKP